MKTKTKWPLSTEEMVAKVTRSLVSQDMEQMNAEDVDRADCRRRARAIVASLCRLPKAKKRRAAAPHRGWVK